MGVEEKSSRKKKGKKEIKVGRKERKKGREKDFSFLLFLNVDFYSYHLIPYTALKCLFYCMDLYYGQHRIEPHEHTTIWVPM